MANIAVFTYKPPPLMLTSKSRVSNKIMATNKVSCVINSIRQELELIIRSRNKDPMIEQTIECLKAYKPADNQQHVAQYYLTYLKSSRLQDEITKRYFFKGDQSVEKSARLVGLELPKLLNK